MIVVTPVTGYAKQALNPDWISAIYPESFGASIQIHGGLGKIEVRESLDTLIIMIRQVRNYGTRSTKLQRP